MFQVLFADTDQCTNVVMKKRDASRMQACEMKFLGSRIEVTRGERMRNERIRGIVIGALAGQDTEMVWTPTEK